MSLFGFLGKDKNTKSAKGGESFFEMFVPSDNLTKPSDHIVQALQHAGAPAEMIDFITKYGFGNYGNGIIKIVDPEDYMESLYTWLGGQDFSKLPFMMTGFGDLFYLRLLGNGEYDISMLDVHYRNISVPAYTFDEFMSYLTDPETVDKILRKDLFAKAGEKCGRITADEIYYFTPALVTGGAEDIKYVDKGTAAVHHMVLFQLGAK